MSHLRSILLASEAAVLALALGGGPAGANECGPGDPAYTAQRTIAVKGGSSTVKVSVSGQRLREERDIGGRALVAVRNLDDGTMLMIDDAARTATLLPAPPKPPQRPETRVSEEPGPGGTKVRRIEFQANGQWLELSRTTCRPDGIMTSQTFTSVDERGQPVTGRLTQAAIQPGPRPASNFQAPEGYARR